MFLILSVHFTKKYYHTLTKNFDIAFSLVLKLACMSGKRGREGAGQLNSLTGFQNLAQFFFQMALKDTKLDSNGVQIANFLIKKQKSITARQLGAPPPDTFYFI